MGVLLLLFMVVASRITTAELPRDRISAQIQITHGEWKTPWLDFIANLLPLYSLSLISNMNQILKGNAK